MRVPGVVVIVSALACGGLAAGGRAAAADWPHLRGPRFDGAVAGTELFARGSADLSLAWRLPLGPGYSGVAVADGRAVTLYSDGTDDWLIAADLRTGREVWRYRLAPTYTGHDGSADGPISTPVIHAGRVIGLGPTGVLCSVDLADGTLRWTRNLPADFDAREPDYGFTTSPVVEEGMLILQTGGPDGRSLSGLDAASGVTRWSVGDGRVEYQSPAVLTLAGERVVVVASGHAIEGFAPSTGVRLFAHVLDENEWVGSSSAMPAGEDRFLIFIGGAAAVFEVSGAGEAGGLTVHEIYRSRELGNTYALPVLHDGHLYGFKAQFLVCVDAATGKRVWKSRPPGGRGLVLVDGHLVIAAAQGDVVLADATPEGYRETARLHVLEGTGLTWPSFAAGKVLLRNGKELAAVSIIPGKASAFSPRRVAAGLPEAPAGTAFARFVEKVEAADDKQGLVSAFLAEHERFPIVEAPWVHFLYDGDVEDIAISGSMLDDGVADAMRRVPGTDLFFRSYRLPPGTRWEYRFNVNFDDRVVDPRNPVQVPARFDDTQWSEVRLPGDEAPAFLAADPARPGGEVRTMEFTSPSLGDTRKVAVWLPPGYADSAQTYPLLVVHGMDWLDKGLLDRALDNLVGTRVEPLVVAVVAPRNEWWLEAGGSATVPYARMLATELVPFLDARFRLDDRAGARAVMGTGGFGLTAAYVALRYPETFGKVAIQSIFLGLGTEPALMKLIRSRPTRPVQFYLDWNRYESRSVDEDRDLRNDGMRLAAALTEAGYTFVGGEVLDSHGWASWRSRTDRILESFFPLAGATARLSRDRPARRSPTP
ncbi:MAG: PQQ-binding-like beta-propeller repeat protein [Acidobacteriota bacterium]